MLGSVAKADRILELFSGDVAEWGVRGAAVELGIPRSTAHAMLSSLTEVGLLQRTPQGRYRLGVKVVKLSRAYLDSSDVRLRAAATIRTVADQFGLAVHLASLTDDGVIYLEQVEGPGTDHIAQGEVGRRLPPHCSAVGKILLAHADRSRADRTIEAIGMPRYTSQTITSLPRLLDELGGVRSRGFASDREEALVGLTCFAAPIVDVDQRVIAAVSVSIKTSRVDSHPARYPRIAVAAGTRISKELRRG
jgi:IclR family KDG regulon transcriptional repressor